MRRDRGKPTDRFSGSGISVVAVGIDPLQFRSRVNTSWTQSRNECSRLCSTTTDPWSKSEEIDHLVMGRGVRCTWTWDQKGITMNKKTITGWAIAVTWSDGKNETILDVDDETAGAVDTFLTELEQERDANKK